jgi:hypothetical protein
MLYRFSSSNFLFHAEKVSLNTSILEQSIEWDVRRLDAGAYVHLPEYTDFVQQLTPELQQAMAAAHDNEDAKEVHSTELAVTARSYGWLSPLLYCFDLNSNNSAGITDSNCRAFFVSDVNSRESPYIHIHL